MERKLVTIRKIDSIETIPDADKIEVAVIDGWKIVIKRGVHSVGENVVYFEIDSWIPHSIAPFLTKSGDFPKQYNGIDGQRLKTIKLRGQVSQGLVIPLDDVGIYEESDSVFKFTKQDGTIEIFHKDSDLTELLGVQKYEKISAEVLSGRSRGNFPSCGRKTDQERCISGDTVVFTDMGEYTIEQLYNDKPSNIKVLSFNIDDQKLEYKSILSYMQSSKTKRPWLKITTESGNSLVVTPEHKIWCEELRCYREAKDFIVGQSLLLKTD